MKKNTISPLPSLSPKWKSRLGFALDGILVFSGRCCGQEFRTKAESRDVRTILEFVEENGVLTRSNLQLALPEPDDLEMLKLGCWTLLYSKALFPEWAELEGWVKGAAEWATETGDPIEEHLQDYRVSCQYDRLANVLDFQIVRS